MKKQVEVTYCDMPHGKQEVEAVKTITLDVCEAHDTQLSGKAGKSFTCDDCGRSFSTKQGLSRHRTRTHTAAETPTPTPPPEVPEPEAPQATNGEVEQSLTTV